MYWGESEKHLATRLTSCLISDWSSFISLLAGGSFNKAELSTFVELNKHPLVTLLNSNNAAKVYASPLNFHVILILPCVFTVPNCPRSYISLFWWQLAIDILPDWIGHAIQERLELHWWDMQPRIEITRNLFMLFWVDRIVQSRARWSYVCVSHLVHMYWGKVLEAEIVTEPASV